MKMGEDGQNSAQKESTQAVISQTYAKLRH